MKWTEYKFSGPLNMYTKGMNYLPHTHQAYSAKTGLGKNAINNSV